MTEDQAQTVALQALGWLVAQEDLLSVFLGSTGAGIDDLRANAGSPETGQAVLDFLAMNDDWAGQCIIANGWADDALQRAQAVLQGAGGMQWT